MCWKPRVRAKTVITVDLLHNAASLREVRSHCRPTKLALELAELLVEVTVTSESRQCVQS